MDIEAPQSFLAVCMLCWKCWWKSPLQRLSHFQYSRQLIWKKVGIYQHGIMLYHLDTIFSNSRLAIYRACMVLAKIVSLLTFFLECSFGNID